MIVKFALDAEYADEQEIQECLAFWKEITSVFFKIEPGSGDGSGAEASSEAQGGEGPEGTEADDMDLCQAARTAAAAVVHEPVAVSDPAALALPGSMPLTPRASKELAERVELQNSGGVGVVQSNTQPNPSPSLPEPTGNEPVGTDRLRFSSDLAAARAIGMQHASPEAPGAANVLYANESLYVYARLHQLLFKRLALARDCARQKDEGSKKPPVTGAVQPLNAASGEPVSEERSTASPAQDSHAAFISLLCQLIGNDSGTDATTYEDQTRELLGTSAYELFTLDKVISRLVRQLYTVAVEKQVCRRLLKLNALHRVRRAALAKWDAPYVLDTQYRDTVCELLDGERDSTCYRLELTALNESVDAGILRARVVLDPDDAPRAPDADEVIGAEGFIHRTLEPLEADAGPSAQDSSAPVFLGRNVRATTSQSRGARLQSASVLNGLEMVASIDGASSSDESDDEDQDMLSLDDEAPKEKRQKLKFDDLPPSKRRRRTNFGEVSRRMVYVADTSDFMRVAS